jgi:hypothetical protein
MRLREASQAIAIRVGPGYIGDIAKEDPEKWVFLDLGMAFLPPKMGFQKG